MWGSKRPFYPAGLWPHCHGWACGQLCLRFQWIWVLWKKKCGAWTKATGRLWTFCHRWHAAEAARFAFNIEYCSYQKTHLASFRLWDSIRFDLVFFEKKKINRIWTVCVTEWKHVHYSPERSSIILDSCWVCCCWWSDVTIICTCGRGRIIRLNSISSLLIAGVFVSPSGETWSNKPVDILIYPGHSHSGSN